MSQQAQAAQPIKSSGNNRASGKPRLLRKAKPPKGTLRQIIEIILFGAVLVTLMTSVAAAQEPKQRSWQATEDSPQLHYDEPIYCGVDEFGQELRLQCEENAEGGPRCLVALDKKHHNDDKLDRTRWCEEHLGPEHLAELEALGYQLVPAIAEAPPGWARDELGRVFQVTFDLLNRFYLGAAWQPNFDHMESSQRLDRVGFDMGFRASVFEPWDRSRHNIRVIQGNVALGGLELEGELAGYDYSHEASEPFLRLVTFFGTPHRFDFGADIGWGLSALDVKSHLGWDTPVTTLEFGELHVAWDLYQSSDLYNIVRIGLGSGVGALWQDELDSAIFFSPTASLDATFGLDQSGLHYLFAQSWFTTHLFASGTTKEVYHHNARAQVGYEWVILSLNDQPLSFHAEAGVDYFGELVSESCLECADVVTKEQFATTATAGLRFSLWAPARLSREEVESTYYY